MQRPNRPANGFSLIELMVVVSIIAVVLAISLPNFLGVRQRARDSKKKTELRELKQALNLYYSDYQTYPADNGGSDGQFFGCGADGLQICPQAGALADCEFAAGGSDCTDSTIYMKLLPRLDGSDYGYEYALADVNNFCLATVLEHTADPDLAESQTRCAAYCTGYAADQYVVCND